jgi:hypothetical protein
MTGEQLREFRQAFGLSRHDFALHVIGYTGNDRNIDLRMRRLESDPRVPLHIGRLVWKVWEDYHVTGKLPQWPATLQIEGEIPPWMSQG